MHVIMGQLGVTRILEFIGHGKFFFSNLFVVCISLRASPHGNHNYNFFGR